MIVVADGRYHQERSAPDWYHWYTISAWTDRITGEVLGNRDFIVIA